MVGPLLAPAIDRGTHRATNYSEPRPVIGTISQRACGRADVLSSSLPKFIFSRLCDDDAPAAPDKSLNRADNRN